MTKWIVLLALLGVVGCSNKEIYNKLLRDQRNKCREEPKSMYSECVERTEKSYEQYQRERDEVLKM